MCSAIVHHGGAGTCAAALRAGLPQLICPFHFDQHSWVWVWKTSSVLLLFYGSVMRGQHYSSSAEDRLAQFVCPFALSSTSEPASGTMILM